MNDISNTMENQKALMPVTPMRSPVGSYARLSETDDLKVLRSLNMRLQLNVHNLENEVGRLREEVKGHRQSGYIYESLTKDLSTLRHQLDKTTQALLQKCDAYNSLKKELSDLKRQYNISPKSSKKTLEATKRSSLLHSPIKHQPSGSGRRRLAIYHEIMGDDELFSSRRSSRPSMGSCGNIEKQISDEEAVPSVLKEYVATAAPLRKSIKSQQGSSQPTSTKKNVQTHAKRIKPTLESSTQSSSLKLGAVKAPPSVRPALGQTNGRVFRLDTSIKKSNSSCSAKSKPVFRL